MQRSFRVFSRLGVEMLNGSYTFLLWKTIILYTTSPEVVYRDGNVNCVSVDLECLGNDGLNRTQLNVVSLFKHFYEVRNILSRNKIHI